MAIETIFKYKGKEKGDTDFLIKKLKEFNLILHEYKFKNEFDIQYTIQFKNKYIWIDHYLEDESDYNFIMCKYSSEFKENPKEMQKFITKMLSIGFEIDEYYN